MNGFVNPYNFIKFPEKKAEAYQDSDTHTGVIEYTITTKTPLFIPNTSSECAFTESKNPDHKSYDFFSYTELEMDKTYENEYHVPVIPGSEIRGVVRQVYETLTDSCMGILNSEEYPVKRTVQRFQPGILYRAKDGGIELLAADSFRIGKTDNPKKEFAKDRNGTKMYFFPEGRDIVSDYSDSRQSRGCSTGFLIKWGMGMKKKHFHVFRPKRGSIIQELSKSNVERKLFPVIESYLSQPQVKEEDKKAYQAYKEDLLAFLGQKGEAFPVCYLKPEKNLELLYLAPAIFTKEVSNHNLGELAGAYAPCEEDICPACDLFGFIRGENENSRNSKVRFADAYVANEMGAEKYYLCNKITLQALGEPKLGNVDFYLERPQTSRFWTYNYYYVNDNIVLKPGQLRGRKFYWHHQKVELSKKIEPDRLNKTVRPVKENVSFKGKMYFEGISNRQLNQLIWILNSGSEGLGLKLGGAKPFGLGSVACFVDRVLERQVKILDEKILYEIAENTKFETVTYETAGYSGFVKKEFYKIAGLTSVPVNINITYPRMELQKEEEILGEGFQWFVNNHKTKFGKMPTKANDLNIAEALPQILDEDITLSYNRNKTSKSNLGNGHNGMDKPKGTFRDNTRRRGR